MLDYDAILQREEWNDMMGCRVTSVNDVHRMSMADQVRLRQRYQQLEQRQRYAEWDESKHPRADDGKFGSGSTASKPDESNDGSYKRIASIHKGITSSVIGNMADDHLARALSEIDDALMSAIRAKDMDIIKQLSDVSDMLYREHRRRSAEDDKSDSRNKNGNNETPETISTLEERLLSEVDGLATLILNEKGNAIELQKIEVDPTARGRGIGGRVIEALQEYARRAHKPIVLEAEPEPRKTKALDAFYKSHGFSKPGRNRDYELPRHTHVWYPD